MEYEYQEYPKMLYHIDGDTCIAIDPDDELSRGDGWYYSPVDAAEAVKKIKKKGSHANST